jgi:hypothetical protein
MIASIYPNNNVENNYKEVFELSSKNPELKDSIYNLADYVKLRTIAKMCPFIEGTAVYTARVILHAFEPDSNYYNYCEYAKRPDRESSERTSNLQQSQSKAKFNEHSEYKIIPNPNNGLFSLYCPDNSGLLIQIYDNTGIKVFEINSKPSQSVVEFNLGTCANGVYNLTITTEISRQNIRFTITK